MKSFYDWLFLKNESSGFRVITLYRAAGDDYINSDSTSFSEDREAAEKYLDNPGYGGKNLYKTRVKIDLSRVLDLTGEHDPVKTLADMLYGKNRYYPGAITADQWVPHISGKLQNKGFHWVRVYESFPENSITWIHLGGSEDPELEQIK